MERLSDNDESLNIYFGDSSQLTNWILDSGATFHRTPQVSYFITVSFKDTYKHIEVAEIHHIMAKQKGQVRINIVQMIQKKHLL